MQIYEETSPFYYTRTDVSDEEKRRVLREQLVKAVESVKAGNIHSAEDVRQFLDELYIKDELKNAS